MSPNGLTSGSNPDVAALSCPSISDLYSQTTICDMRYQTTI
jgi:hypothetical protein